MPLSVCANTSQQIKRYSSGSQRSTRHYYSTILGSAISTENCCRSYNRHPTRQGGASASARAKHNCLRARPRTRLFSRAFPLLPSVCFFPFSFRLSPTASSSPFFLLPFLLLTPARNSKFEICNLPFEIPKGLPVAFLMILPYFTQN